MYIAKTVCNYIKFDFNREFVFQRPIIQLLYFDLKLFI